MSLFTLHCMYTIITTFCEFRVSLYISRAYIKFVKVYGSWYNPWPYSIMHRSTPNFVHTFTMALSVYSVPYPQANWVGNFFNQMLLLSDSPRF